MLKSLFLFITTTLCWLTSSAQLDLLGKSRNYCEKTLKEEIPGALYLEEATSEVGTTYIKFKQDYSIYGKTYEVSYAYYFDNNNICNLVIMLTDKLGIRQLLDLTLSFDFVKRGATTFYNTRTKHYLIFETLMKDYIYSAKFQDHE